MYLSVARPVFEQGGDTNSVFLCRQASRQGELRVVYDDDVVGLRVMMAADDDTLFCNHIICRKHVLQK